MGQFKKIMITVIYGIGVLMVCVLLGCMLFLPHIVLNPDAMIPMQMQEMSSILLALGFIPMLITTILFCNIDHISQSFYKKLTYIPTVICLLCAIYWACIWLIGIVLM